MEALKAFAAGFISTLVFHQALMTFMYEATLWPTRAYPMAATSPLQVPAVISLAFWGGLWGIALWLAILGMSGPAYWAAAAVLGALGPTLVALFIVFPLKGKPVAAGGDRKIIIGALILNGTWGLGTALLLRLLTKT